MDENEVWAEDDFYDDTDELGAGEVSYQAEIGLFERAGPEIDPLIRRRIDGQPMTRAERAMQDPLERFVTAVDARSRELASQPTVQLNERQIAAMRTQARGIANVGYKNVTAYILGFLASNEGQRMDKESFDRVMQSVYPYVEDKKAITPPDIVRYARLWVRMVSGEA